MIDQKDFNRILAAIKRIFSQSSVRKRVLHKALSKQVGPRGGKMYNCKKCKKAFNTKGVQVDHIDPVCPIGVATMSMSWDLIMERLYCSESNLQVLCRKCHDLKSKKEAGLRAKARKLNKND